MAQWAPITGLFDSCSPPVQPHLLWEGPATDGWPVEDIVSWRRVIAIGLPEGNDGPLHKI